MQKNNSNLKYKEGDVVVLSYRKGVEKKVRKITNINEETTDYYPLLDSVYDGIDHIGACYDEDIEGLYNGKIGNGGDVWHPKYNIGDAILVHVEGFGDKPTWHTIYYIEYYGHISCITKKCEFSERYYNIGSEEIVLEKDVLDVIRYGETVTTTESKK